MAYVKRAIALAIVGLLAIHEVTAGSSSGSSSSVSDKHKRYSKKRTHDRHLPDLGLSQKELEDIQKDKLHLEYWDEFDYANFNTHKWLRAVTANRGGNDEFQYYSADPRVSYIHKGVLIIKPQKAADLVWNHIENRPHNPYTDAYSERNCLKDPCHSVPRSPGISLPYLSARIYSKREFRVDGSGILVIRAKMPRGDYLWPIMQLLPVGTQYGEWPASGGITLAQTRGNTDYRTPENKQVGNAYLESLVFYGSKNDQRTIPMTLLYKEWLSEEYHHFKCTWNNGEMKFFIDNEEYGSINLFKSVQDARRDSTAIANEYKEKDPKAPFDNTFRLALMVGVGGRGYFNDAMKTGDNPEHSTVWSYARETPMRKFYEGMETKGWAKTWQTVTKKGKRKDLNALKVDYIRYYEYGSKKH